MLFKLFIYFNSFNNKFIYKIIKFNLNKIIIYLMYETFNKIMVLFE